VRAKQHRYLNNMRSAIILAKKQCLSGNKPDGITDKIELAFCKGNAFVKPSGKCYKTNLKDTVFSSFLLKMLRALHSFYIEKLFSPQSIKFYLLNLIEKSAA